MLLVAWLLAFLGDTRLFCGFFFFFEGEAFFGLFGAFYLLLSAAAGMMPILARSRVFPRSFLGGLGGAGFLIGRDLWATRVRLPRALSSKVPLRRSLKIFSECL